MKKYRIWASKCYELEVEAANEDEAFEKAIETPFSEWEDYHPTYLQFEDVEEGDDT
jgi:hypothetical protein